MGTEIRGLDCESCEAGPFTVDCELLVAELFAGHPKLHRLCFACPVCRHRCRRELSEEAWSRLSPVRASGELRTLVLYVPAEALEPRPAGPALNTDDLLDLLLDLDKLTCEETSW